MKKFLALMLALVMALSLVACGEQNTPAADSSADGNTAATTGLAGSADETYVMNVFVSGVEYWFPVYAGMKDACKQLGVSCSYGGTTEYDAQAQVDSFEADLAKSPKGILLSPIVEDAFVEPINRAIAQGVAVVTYASDAPDSNRQAYVTSDNVNEGTIAARTICDDMGGTGSVMVLRNPGQDNHNRRCDAFIATVEAEYPNIKVVADVATNQDEQAGYDAVMATYQKNPNLGGVFCPEGVSIVGGAKAAKELGTGIRCLCVDTNDTLLDMLKDGDMFGLICPDQYMQGYLGMMSLFIAAHPENVNPMNERKALGENIMGISIDNGLTIITKDTADYYYVAKYAQSIGYADVNDMLSAYKAG